MNYVLSIYVLSYNPAIALLALQCPRQLRLPALHLPRPFIDPYELVAPAGREIGRVLRKGRAAESPA